MSRHLRAAPFRGDPRGERPIRIVLAEAHAAMRQSLRLLLDADPRFEVMGETQNLAQTRAQVRELQPDVLVLDRRLPDGLGITAIADLRTQAPRVKVVILTMHDSPRVARQALEAGATGFVVKDMADAELPEAVSCAARGKRYMSPRMSLGLALLKPANPAG